jgi:hypothetical protein
LGKTLFCVTSSIINTFVLKHIIHFFMIAMKRNILIITLFFMACLPSLAQTNSNPDFRIGGFVNYSRNYHDANMLVDCCPVNESGKGYGIPFGLLVEYQAESFLSFQLKIFRNDLSGDLTRFENVILTIEGQPIDGLIENHNESDIKTISFSPGFLVNLTPGLVIGAGATLNFITNSSYEQYEKIIDPAWGVFPGTGTRVKNHSTGEITNTNSLVITLDVNLRYSIPMNSRRTIFLAPELSYKHGVTDVVDGVEWKVNQISAGLNILFRI